MESEPFELRVSDHAPWPSWREVLVSMKSSATGLELGGAFVPETLTRIAADKALLISAQQKNPISIVFFLKEI